MINDYTLVLKTEAPLSPSKEYVLKLSGSSGGNEIKLPGEGTYEAYIRIGKFMDDLSASNPIIAENALHLGGIIIQKQASSVGDTGGSGSGSLRGTFPTTDENPDKQVVLADSLTSSKDGKVSIAIEGGKKQVLLPANAAELLGNNQLVLEGPGISAAISPAVLQELKGLISVESAQDAQILFEANPLTDEANQALIDKARKQTPATLRQSGHVYELKLAIVTKDGKEMKLNNFSTPIELTMPYTTSADMSLLGIYYLNDQGIPEYLPTEKKNGVLRATVQHFSNYAALEYDLTFQDVTKTHWAFRMIKEMAAKHIVDGTESGDFQPERAMTRAEFTALITRSLGLKTSMPSSFGDIAPEAWYANAIAAANQAGIIEGRGLNEFEPNSLITREEMAAIIVRAYTSRYPSELRSDQPTTFSDRASANDWALPYIDGASKAGLVHGRENNEFAPHDHMHRAEGTQIVFNLLNASALQPASNH
ncbi:MAG: pullulanase [Paenibacillus sp.]|nr:pullulanase [Paenibacillus sp.]